MASKETAVTVHIDVPWWAVPYLKAVAMFAMVHGVKPDVEKVIAQVMRHVKVRVEGAGKLPRTRLVDWIKP